jgi:hypothetical protein
MANLPDDMHFEVSSFLGSPSTLALLLSLGKQNTSPILQSELSKRKARYAVSGMLSLLDTARMGAAKSAAQPKKPLQGSWFYTRPVASITTRNEFGLPVRFSIDNPYSRYSQKNSVPHTVSFDLSFPSSRAYESIPPVYRSSGEPVLNFDRLEVVEQWAQRMHHMGIRVDEEFEDFFESGDVDAYELCEFLDENGYLGWDHEQPTDACLFILELYICCADTLREPSPHNKIKLSTSCGEERTVRSLLEKIETDPRVVKILTTDFTTYRCRKCYALWINNFLAGSSVSCCRFCKTVV